MAGSFRWEGPDGLTSPSIAVSPCEDGRIRRAGDGNRTRTTSLEGWSSTIELHPRGASLATPGWDTSPVEVGFRLVDAFTETPFKGNRLCVVPVIPEGLSDDQMR